MIKLTRESMPFILQSKRSEWDRSLQIEMSKGLTVNQSSVSKNYNHPDIKLKLMASSHEKCMYCESKVRHIDHGEIEHIKPKSRFPNEIFNWNNLGFVCSMCNSIKRDQFIESLTIIDPFSDDPSAHLRSCGSIIFPKPGSDRGRMTILTLKLNRAELVEKREEKIKQIHELLETAARVAPELMPAIKREIEEYISPTQEYSFIGQVALKLFD